MGVEVLASLAENDVEVYATLSETPAIPVQYEPGSVGGGLTNDVKDALLQIARKVVYVDAGGQTYYDALYAALYPLSGISCVYTQSGTVYNTDSLDSLKTDLVVTAEYGDGNTETVAAADYTLSGSLVAGNSTITVTYESFTTTFNVTVTQVATLSSISAVYTQTTTVYADDPLSVLDSDLVVTAHYSDNTDVVLTSGQYTLSGSLTVGTSTITATYEGETDTFSVTVSAVPVLSSISAVYTQSGTVYTTDSLDSLKTDLVVTATYSDSSSETVPSADYTLSGSLTEGTSTITATYESKTTTFTVTVTLALPTGYTRYDYIYNKTAQIATVMDTGIAGSYCSSDYGHELIFAYVDSISTTSYGMYGARDQSGTGTSRAYWLKSENGVPKIDCTYNGAAAGFTEISAGTKYDMITANGKWTVNGTDWDDSMSGTFTAPEPNIRLFGVVTGTTNSYSRAKIKIYGFKVWEIATGTVIANLVPCVKTSNSKPGFYDTARSQFITITNYTNLEAGNDA